MTNLPEEFKYLFWSYDFKRLDSKKDKRLIMLQIINYGSLESWKWLFKTYNKEEIKDFIEETPQSEFRPGALKLAMLLVGAEKISHAQRGTI